MRVTLAGLFFFLSVSPIALAQSTVIVVPGGPGGLPDNPLTHAAHKLAADLGAPWQVATSATGTPGVVVADNLDYLTGQQYRIAGGGSSTVFVEASTQAGAINGVHGLRRRLMERGAPAGPWGTFDETVTPNFERRGVMVAPYGFGGQQGIEAFGCDQWGIDEWKDYVDYLRLLNANFLEVFPIRMWHPDRPETFLEKARYDVWAQVLDYCHEVGMEFHFCMLLNQVTSGFWWDNPSLRVGTGWRGTAASFADGGGLSNTNPLIAEQEPTFAHFANADAFVFMWNDGGAADYGAAHMSNPARTLRDQVLFARDRIAAVGSDARIIFWGWLQEPWYRLTPVPQPAFYANSLSLLSPANLGFEVEWLQESSRHYPDHFPAAWNLSEPFAGPLSSGITKVSDFLYYNNLEDPREIMPLPRIAETSAEVRHAKNHGVNGITGYRLTPATRRLNDYVTLRLADDVDLTPSTATVSDNVRLELANFLARGSAPHATVIDGALATTDAAYPQPLRGPWNVLSAPFANAFLAVNPIPIQNADLTLWKQLLGFQAGTYLWIDVIDTLAADPAFAAVGGWVDNKRIFRGFTTQPQWSTEGNAVLEQFMRRIHDPF